MSVAGWNSASTLDLGGPGGLADLGTVAKCNAVLDHYDQIAASARNALQVRSNGFYGHVFGPGQSEMSALAAVIDNNKRELLAIRLKVMNGEKTLDDLVAAAKADEKDVADTAGYAITSSLEDVLAKTAVQSGQDVSQTVTTVAATAGSFALSAIPWWVYLAALGVVLWKVSPRGRAA